MVNPIPMLDNGRYRKMSVELGCLIGQVKLLEYEIDSIVMENHEIPCRSSYLH